MNEATLLRALSHPDRLKVMRLLAQGELQVHELVAALGREQSAVSHQLKVLREAGLVESNYGGGGVVYRTAHPRLNQFVDEIAEVASTVEGVCRCVECGGTLVRPYPSREELAQQAPRGKPPVR